MTAQELDLMATILFCEADGRFKTRKAAEEVIKKCLVAEGITHPAPIGPICSVCDEAKDLWRVKSYGPEGEWHNRCETCGTCWSID